MRRVCGTGKQGDSNNMHGSQSGPGQSPWNATMRKFGAPETCIREYEHWILLLRPRQATLGALVLAAREPAGAWPELSAEAFGELRAVTAETEAALHAAFTYDRINYLMLMMVDPDVHFHVLPRYSAPRTFAAQEFEDPGWPGPPALSETNETSEDMNGHLVRHIASFFA